MAASSMTVFVLFSLRQTVKSKRCFKCEETKSITEFYAHPEMADGRLGKCKTCTKKDVSNYWHEHAVVLRQTDGIRRRIKRAANQKTSNAIRDKRLVRADQCFYCGDTEGIDAHHWNYYRPLDVTWLCARCHRIADMARRDAEVKVALGAEVAS
jgi:hypothetical protein